MIRRGKVTLESRLDKIVSDARHRSPDIVEAVTAQMADEAAHRAPHTTGDLQSSIEAVPHEGGGAVIADIPWRQLEFGTVKMGAQPFMVPTAEHHQIPFLRQIRDLFT